MLDMRWCKVWREIKSRKSRTALVILSIAVGVFGVGVMLNCRIMLFNEMDEAYLTTRPAHIELQIDPFEDDLVKTVRRIPGVVEAEGRATLSRRLLGMNKEYILRLDVAADYDRLAVNRIRPISGDWPPPPQEIVLERRSLEFLGVQPGDTVSVEDYNGKLHRLRVAGTAYDLNAPIPALSHIPTGYISQDTQIRLDGNSRFNRLILRVAAPGNIQTTRQIAQEVEAKIKRCGLQVYSVSIPAPGSHPANSIFSRILLLLGGLAVLTLILSSCLMINVISAILAEQIRQIGMMKALGARAHQLVEMYLAMVLIYAAFALLLAVPLGVWAGYSFTGMVAYSFNVDVSGFSVSPLAPAVQTAVGLAVPVLAALYPVLKGTRITPHQAITDYGLGQNRFGKSALDRLIASPRFSRLPRPLLLALRNTFRRKTRLAFTLLTLTVAGTAFVGVLGVRDSIRLTFDTDLNCWQYDADIVFNRPYRTAQVQREAMAVPGVVAVETWNVQSMHRLRTDDSFSREMTFMALPAASPMIEPVLIEGRWLLPADENALVINTDVLRTDPDIKIGDEIRLQFEEERPTRWRVVGIVLGVITGPMLFVNQPYYSQLTHTAGMAEQVQVVTEYPAGTKHTDAAFQMKMAKALEARFEQTGIRVASITLNADRRAWFMQILDVFMGVLAAAALLLAVVGVLGLTGTMSINVLERTREIGVMRAIGATDRMVQQIVLIEGMLIGLLGWFLGSLLAWPLGIIVNHLAETYIFNSRLQYTFSTGGALLWGGVIILLSVSAGYFPAQKASRLTVRETLAYE